MFNAPSRFVGEIPEDLMTRETGERRRKRTTTRSRYKSTVSSNGNSGKSRRSKDGSDYSVGDVVQHKIFGRGKIVDVSGSGENQKLSVVFTGNMKKKLLAKYANLTSPNE
jgi:DNA helicase-2/ATP-dependent DNA helicase PcrA